MPKTGQSDDEWRARIREYVAGKKFGQGQRPPSSSKWAKVIELIDICPVKVNSSSKDLFGRPIRCSCGYHEVVA